MLPLAVPGIIAGCILVAIPATGEYVIPQILGGGKTLMFGNVIADQFLDIGDYPFGRRDGDRADGRADDRADGPALAQLQGGGRSVVRRRLPRPTSVFTAIVMVCLYVPIVVVVVYSVDKSTA